MSRVFVDVGMSLDGFIAGPNDDIVKAVFARTGANILGRRMFDEGEVGWPEHAPFHTPVFLLTHHPREPWVRPGGTTFFFVTDGFDSALEKARAAAGDLDVRVSGGANVIRRAIKAGAVDEIAIHVAPILMGRGVRLFDQLTADDLALQPVEAIHSPVVSHLRYLVVR